MCRDTVEPRETMNRVVKDDDAIIAGFEALYEASIDRVYSYARTRLGPTEAEDVASEVFHAALVALQGGRGEAVTESWLMAVVRNKVIDRWRAAERRMTKRHLFLSRQNDAWPGADDNLQSDRLLLALDTLSDRHRALLILHYVDGFPMKDVARQLETSVESARSGIARARRALAGAYEKVTLDV